jgi:uncharacterized protein YhaN
VILRRLRARRFLGLPDEAFEFAPGVNVVIGPNEAGKSSLRAAIHAVLYGNPATTSTKFRDEFRSWGAEEPPVLELEFEVDGKRFVLSKDFATRKVTLQDELGRTWDQHKIVQERIAAQLGLVTEDLFDATAQVAQAELERIHLNSIAKELGRIVGGGGEDVATAIRRLEQHVRGMEKGTKALTKDPGVLRALDDKVASLKEEQRRLSASAAAADRTRADLAGLRETFANATDTLTNKRALLDQNREIVTVEERLAGRQREEAMLEEKVKKIEDTLTKIAQVGHELESSTAAGLPDEDTTAAARKLSDRAAAFEMQSGQLRHQLDQPDEIPAAHRLWRVAGTGGAALLLSGTILAIAARVPAGWVLAGGGAILAAVGWWQVSRVARERARAEIRREERERYLAVLERTIESTRVDLGAKLAQLGCATVKEAEQRLQHHRDLARTRVQLEQFLTDQRAGRTDEDIAEQWKTVRRDVFGLQERLHAPEIAARRLTPLQLTALEREVQQLAQQVAGQQDKERRLSVELERHSVDADALATVEEQLHEAEEQLTSARHHHEVYTSALSGLLDARRQAQVPVREIMERRAGEYLRILSEARYQRLAADQESLALSVWSDDADGWVEAAEPHLSRGTVDLVYLAARLALVEVLTGGKRPPLLFDDPFITFDDRRRQAAATLMRELARSHQIFVFTYTRHFDGVADRLIELPARGEATPPEDRPPMARPQLAPAPVLGPLWDPPRPD